jgi:hypothetical protein
MGSRETKRIYGINPATWTVGWESAAPGTPWGMTAIEDELRVLCGETADDNRIIRRCIPWRGFDGKFGIPCPDDTGSQLGYDGHRLHVSQWYPKKVLALGTEGQVESVIHVPHGICGQVFVDGFIYLARPTMRRRATIGSPAWTCARRRRGSRTLRASRSRPGPSHSTACASGAITARRNQIVSFARPD